MINFNSILIRKDKLTDKRKILNLKQAYQEQELRNKLSHSNANKQWQEIKHLKYINL
tara:strand:- start:67 stop:237 length:171 start_codon:yes stop_codon:yes gene_type:complete